MSSSSSISGHGSGSGSSGSGGAWGDGASMSSSLGLQAPRALIIAALFYWGFANEGLIAACCISLVLMGQYFIRWRWEFSDDRFSDMFHLCLLILLGAGVSMWSATNDGLQTIIDLFKWLPLVFVPLFAAQIYSTAQTVSLKTFFQVLRLKEMEERRSGRTPTPVSRVALDYPYFILIMASASAANRGELPFYVAAIGLVIWAFWQQHSNRSHPILVVVLVAIVCGLGFAGQRGLYNLQRVVENWNWFSNYFDDQTDLKMSTTTIGALRDVKLGGKVLYRLRKHPGNPAPYLLQEATYSTWMSGRWNADKDLRAPEVVKALGEMPDKYFDLLTPPEAGGPVLTGPATREYTTTIIGTAKSQNDVLLALPPGTRRLEGMPAMTVKKTMTGAVKVTPDRNAYTLQVTFNPVGPRFDQEPLADPPGSWNYVGEDAKLPDLTANAEENGEGNRGAASDKDARPALTREVEVISKLADDLGLARMKPADAANRIRAYFRENYTYSLTSRHGAYQNRNPHSPLVDFLRDNREGHCEYFATATVLLLRASGIPARYTVGYSVQEFSAFERAYLIRSLHAHAWAVAWYDGAWHEVDATPPGWLGEDSQNLPYWQPVKDFIGALWSNFNQWRANGGADRIRVYAPWVVLATLLIIGGRSLFGKGTKRRHLKDEPGETFARLGRDSSFYPVMKELARLTEPPGTGETTLNWLHRIQPRLACLRPADGAGAAFVNSPELTALLDQVIHAHYRYRFDPLPMPAADKARLEELCRRCLDLLQPRATEAVTA